MYNKSMRALTRMMAIVCVALVAPGNILLWADPTDTSSPPEAPIEASAQSPALTADQVNSLVAPIALYPDELVSQILVASTYPLEVVQAHQWLQQHSDVKGQELTAAAQKQNWDPSVQALVVFPDVLKRMNQDVTWTTNLGNTFLAHQADVMDAIQKMRVRAQDAGKLSSTPQQKVVNTTENGHPIVAIEPANPEGVYVPDYAPVWIWGPAPVYYPYPYWYYPPPPLGGWCWWGPEIVLGAFFIGWSGWGGWGWHPGWHDRAVIFNNAFVVRNHFNTAHFRDGHGTGAWRHDSFHRLGVSYPNRALAGHYNSFARPASRVTVQQARQQFQASATRMSAARSADRFGSRQIAPGVFNHNRTAFGGIEAGSAARVHSNRGYSSMGHAR